MFEEVLKYEFGKGLNRRIEEGMRRVRDSN
jgi:hypothetical protein